MWSDMLITNLIANAPELQFGQEVIHGDLKCLHYDMGDMHIPYPNIEENMKLPKMVNVKQILENCLEIGF
jgi:hypothetical protein